MSTDLHKHLILGLGTGRSGTMSLTKLLNLQKHSYFVHEGAYNLPTWLQHTTGNYLPWEVDTEALATWFENIRTASKDARYYGDVGASILPYVELILDKVPDTKFICIQRDKRKVVDSFMKITVGTNHWDTNHVFRELNYFDAMFPKLDADSKAAAIEKYWEMYYSECDRLAHKYPESVFVFDIEHLNTVSGRQQLLSAAGFALLDQKTDVTIHTNKSTHAVLHIIFQTLIIMLEMPRKVLARLLK